MQGIFYMGGRVATVVSYKCPLCQSPVAKRHIA